MTSDGSIVLAGTVDVGGDCHAAAGALSPSDGTRSWFRVLGRTQDCGFEELAVGTSSVFVAWEDRDSTLASLDPSDGTVIWSRDLPRLRLVSTLAAAPSLLIVEGGIRRRGTVAAFDSDDGTRAWSTELRRVDAYGIYALHAPSGGDTVYAAGSRRHGEAFVTALALGNGGRRGTATYDGTWSYTQWVALAAIPEDAASTRPAGPSRARTASPRRTRQRPPTAHGRDRNRGTVPAWRRRRRPSRCRDATSRSRARTRSISPTPRAGRSRSSRSWSTGRPWPGQHSTGVATGRRSCTGSRAG